MKKRKDKVPRDRDGLTRCRVCGCTEREPCNPPCEWASEDFGLGTEMIPADFIWRTRPICINCYGTVQEMADWAFAAHRPRIAPLVREYKAELKRQEAGG